MKNKKSLLAVILVFALLLGGAYVVYGKIAEKSAPDTLIAAPDTQSTDASSDKNEVSEFSPAPDFTMYDENGNPILLSSFIGKPVVLNFWASWCPPCRMEMPEFNEKYLEHQENVEFIMLNMTSGRETMESAREFLNAQSFDFPVFYDTAQQGASTYGAYSLPTTFFIDAQGRIVAQAVGAIDKDTLQRGIDMIYENHSL